MWLMLRDRKEAMNDFSVTSMLMLMLTVYDVDTVNTEGSEPEEELQDEDWGLCEHDGSECGKHCPCECEECWCDHQGEPCGGKDCQCECEECWWCDHQGEPCGGKDCQCECEGCLDDNATEDWGPCTHFGDNRSCCCGYANEPGYESCDCQCVVCWDTIKDVTIPFAWGWRAVFNEEHERFCYYNNQTHADDCQTCWELPGDMQKHWDKPSKGARVKATNDSGEGTGTISSNQS